DRKSTRLNSSHSQTSYAVFCLKKKESDRESAGEQDRGVERGYADRGNGAEGRVGPAADVPRAVGRPDGLELRPENEVAEHLDTLAPEPRHRQHARIEQRAEERGEEHHLGEDEPHHSHAETTIDLQVVDAVLVLADHG